jgi:hypothetical protein
VSHEAESLRYWYGASIPEFNRSSAEEIVGRLTINSSFDVDRTQATAWLAEIELLQSNVKGLIGSIFLEFSIPRMGRRIDAVIVTRETIFALEFKVGSDTFDRFAIEQVWDYGLDLKNFHQASHNAPIIPVLIATEARTSPPVQLVNDADKVYRPTLVSSDGLRRLLESASATVSEAVIDAEAWEAGSPRHHLESVRVNGSGGNLRDADPG